MENQQPPQPNLCRANCGFYGSPQFEDFCSKCFKDYIKRKNTSIDGTNRHSPTNTSTSLAVAALGSATVAVLSDTGSTQTTQPVAELKEATETDTTGNKSDESVLPVSEDSTTKDAKHKSGTESECTVAGKTLSSASKESVTESASADSTTTITPGTSSKDSTPTSSTDLCANTGGDEQQEEKPKKPPNRCHQCNKKVGLTGIPCRCGGIYCSEHRYSQAHQCTFDYKTVEREGLRQNNPVVVSNKIDRI